MAINRQWQQLSVEVDIIADQYNYRTEAFRLLFSRTNPDYFTRFGAFSTEEIRAVYDELTAQNEHDSGFRLLAAIEAAFRVDYKTRCVQKLKDDLSKTFRKLYQEKENQASLTDKLFEYWKHSGLVRPSALSELKSAFKYRHWLAHGRYCTPKFGRNYDFFTLYTLAKEIESFPLLVP